ncbi:MAG: hypothetical protein JSW04_14970 [Desulfobacterales bacterium]|nr:MAG: hypothetical protein JSV38_02960 [Desulfobacterales bacterium]UCD89682.1 MAG: hypothetical protein JSW04_14970 [Desulfobacterales bacterium]
MLEEKFDKRFGYVAIENGFITRDQLIEALKVQLAEELQGMEHRLIGNILQTKEYMTYSQTDEVLKLMGV